MSLTLKLEATGADTIEKTCAEMCAAANRLGLWVKVMFNDVTLLAAPGSDPRELVAAFNEQIEMKRPCKIAVAHAGTPRGGA